MTAVAEPPLSASGSPSGVPPPRLLASVRRRAVARDHGDDCTTSSQPGRASGTEAAVYGWLRLHQRGPFEGRAPAWLDHRSQAAQHARTARSGSAPEASPTSRARNHAIDGWPQESAHSRSFAIPTRTTTALPPDNRRSCRWAGEATWLTGLRRPALRRWGLEPLRCHPIVGAVHHRGQTREPPPYLIETAGRLRTPPPRTIPLLCPICAPSPQGGREHQDAIGPRSAFAVFRAGFGGSRRCAVDTPDRTHYRQASGDHSSGRAHPVDGYRWTVIHSLSNAGMTGLGRRAKIAAGASRRVT